MKRRKLYEGTGFGGIQYSDEHTNKMNIASQAGYNGHSDGPMDSKNAKLFITTKFIANSENKPDLAVMLPKPVKVEIRIVPQENNIEETQNQIQRTLWAKFGKFLQQKGIDPNTVSPEDFDVELVNLQGNADRGLLASIKDFFNDYENFA